MGAEFRGLVSGLAVVAIAVLVLIDIRLPIPGLEVLQTPRFHIALAMLPLPLLLMLSGAWRRALGMLALIVLSIGIGGMSVQELLARRALYEDAPALASLSVVSFNVLATNAEPERAMREVIDQDADIVVLLETSGVLAQLPSLEAQYPTRIGCSDSARCDTALFSRLPLADPHIYLLGPMRRDRLITAKVTVGGQILTVMALHLTKPYFDDFGWIDLTEIRTLLRNVTGPVLLTGDFNAAPWSYSVARFAKQMELMPGPSFPSTWPVEAGDFGVPIDNMLSRDGAIIRSIAAFQDPLGSNHRGLLAKVDIVQAVE